MGKSRHLAQHVPVRTAWPTLNVVEPMSGDFGVIQPPISPSVAQHESRFLELYHDAITKGEFSLEAWNSWADLCSIPLIPWHENCAPVPAQTLLSLELMSDICEDYVPHIGLFIDDLMWGGLGEQSLWPLGGAIASTLPLLKHSHCALYKMAEQHPRLRDKLHKSLTAHHRTPTMLWEKSGNTVTPMLKIGQQYIPTHVENLNEIAGKYFIAKMIHLPTEGPWKANFVLSVPEQNVHELQAFLQVRLLIAWFRYRRHNHKICFEDILRERSDLIYRSSIKLFD